MTTEFFVEECFALSPKEILKNLRSEMGIGLLGPTAYIKARADVSYWLEDPSDPSIVMVSVGGSEPQHLIIEWEEITFGERAYFQCECGLRVSKLYLPPNGTEFKCRKCHKLQYQLTRINRHSTAGRVLYRLNRLQKLANSRTSMGRILYNGNYSDRFERFLRLCDRAGYKDIVKGAEDLKALIRS